MSNIYSNSFFCKITLYLLLPTNIEVYMHLCDRKQLKFVKTQAVFTVMQIQWQPNKQAKSTTNKLLRL